MIESEEFDEGHPIPPERELCELYGTNLAVLCGFCRYS